MARVWAAEQTGGRGFRKTVAIKTILPSLAADPQFEAMFLDEARVAAMVHHPTVCEIFDLGEDQRVLYLAMEWIDGESLARIIKPPVAGGEAVAKRVNPRGAARIIADAASGIHAAHELCDHNGTRLDVVHRDVSPQNILVSVDGTVKVTDFGVAKALGNMQEATMAGQVKGKAAYMSPEQAAGGRVDRRSDVFALGICLYEATTGVRPFAAENQLMTLKKVLAAGFVPPSAVVPGYPKELETIVLRAMEREPMQRFPTAERMQHALEEWLARSGPLVTATQIGTLVRERVGQVVEDRRTRIREAMRKNEAAAPTPSQASFAPVLEPVSGSHAGLSQPSSQPSTTSQPSTASQPSTTSQPGSQPSSAAISRVGPAGSYVSPSARPTRSRRPSAASTVMLGVGIGLGAFVLIGAITTVAWFATRGDEQPVGTVVATATPEPAAPETSPDTDPAAAPAAAPSSAPPEAPIEMELVEFDFTPATGISLELDGERLPPGTTAIERPAKGVTKRIVARADGFEQKIVNVGHDAPEKLVVKLEAAEVAPPTPAAAPKPAAEQKPAAPKPAAEAKPAEKPPEPKPTKKPTPIVPDIPDNPF